MKKESKTIGLGLITAISASLCCITPVLALIAGTSGMASTFSWIEPFRPYLIVLTIVVIGFAWYQKLKPKAEVDCHCEPDEKPKFLQSSLFLGLVTVFAAAMLAIPYYSSIFYPESTKETVTSDATNIISTEFFITGMTCTGCEEHVNHEVNKLDGIVSSITSYEKGNAIIQYDQTKTDVSQIEQAILTTGYEISSKKEK